MNSRSLYEILVPCQFNNGKPVRTRHHKNWDAKVRSISGGLTILSPAKGQWIYKSKLFEERVIPVRIYYTEKQIKKIISFTLSHYKQIAVMCYVISDKVFLIEAKDEENPNIVSTNW